jgi:hypothetical protein
MNKDKNKQMVNISNPSESRNDSTAPSDPKEEQPKQPKEGSIRKIDESSTNPSRFDDNYEVAEENAISEENVKSEDENNS